MSRLTLTNVLLAAIFVMLLVFALRHDVLPVVNAAAPAGQAQIFGCDYTKGGGCTLTPIAVDGQGRLLVSVNSVK